MGEIVRETPTMLVIKLTTKTFEPKSSHTFTHKFTKERRKYLMEGFIPFEKKFYKKNGQEVGGNKFIVNYKIS